MEGEKSHYEAVTFFGFSYPLPTDVYLPPFFSLVSREPWTKSILSPLSHCQPFKGEQERL